MKSRWWEKFFVLRGRHDAVVDEMIHATIEQMADDHDDELAARRKEITAAREQCQRAVEAETAALRKRVLEAEETGREQAETIFKMSDHLTIYRTLREPMNEPLKQAVLATAGVSNWLKLVVQLLNGHREDAMGRATNPLDTRSQEHYCGVVDGLTQFRDDLLGRVEAADRAAKN